MYEKNTFQDAMKYFTSAITANKNAWMAYAGLARTHWQLNDKNAANRYFQNAINIKPDEYSMRRDLGVIRYQAGLISEAIYQLEIARELAPDDPIILETLGLCYFDQKEFQKCTDIIKTIAAVKIINQKDRQEFERRTDLDLNGFLLKVLEYKLGKDMANKFYNALPQMTPGQIQLKVEELLGLNSKLLILLLSLNK